MSCRNIMADFIKKALLAFILFAISNSISYAQSDPYNQQENRQESQNLPTSSLALFPELPPSELCETWKLYGTWRLLMVYEVPPGVELKRYQEAPIQYYVFSGDSRYGEYLGGLRDVSLKEIKEIAMTRQKNIQQFVVSKEGLLFLYKDSIPIDSLACFIVAKDKKPFTRGQMLLMLPEHVAVRGSRMVKVYNKVIP
ncbi:MAG: hypothetical protein R3D71_01480 [Rickettsiales bacterium]